MLEGHHIDENGILTIQGWVVRESDNLLHFTMVDKPYKPEGENYWRCKNGSELLDWSMYPELTFDSEPMEVEVKIFPKSK